MQYCRFSTNEQGFPHCAEASPKECTHSDIWEIVVYPMIMYCLWQLSYIVVVSVCLSSYLSVCLSVHLSDGKKEEEEVDSCGTRTHDSQLYTVMLY